MHWSDIEEIIVGLEEAYAEEEIPEYNLEYLKEMVLSLAEFEDQEIEVSEDNLKQIMESWIELRADG
ncbi:MAG: Fe-S cluster assembly protein IscX [Rickettsiaceae bacterium]|jgi:FeS assembly protein IscX|nr:Fe-S cluster assembly protein IscX [Rickettsiaceae bacterium]